MPDIGKSFCIRVFSYIRHFGCIVVYYSSLRKKYKQLKEAKKSLNNKLYK